MSVHIYIYVFNLAQSIAVHACEWSLYFEWVNSVTLNCTEGISSGILKKFNLELACIEYRLQGWCCTKQE